ncbi:MAG: RecX family transcriptional regulator [Clostridia bacterium]|nr:RecX family transcriptional regulator [Clostridia bacterium]
MYTIEEFDREKTKVFKYIIYKKRTENEIRKKFGKDIEENILEDIIEYLKEAGYINDYDYIERQVREYMALKNMSIKEIEYKLYQKGINSKLIEKYIQENREELEEFEQKSMKNLIAKKSNQMQDDEIKAYLYRKGYKI